jgi:hypothetical protein
MGPVQRKVSELNMLIQQEFLKGRRCKNPHFFRPIFSPNRLHFWLSRKSGFAAIETAIRGLNPSLAPGGAMAFKALTLRA